MQTRKGAATFAMMLRFSSCIISQVTLQWNYIDASGFEDIFLALRKNKSVRAINASYNSAGKPALRLEAALTPLCRRRRARRVCCGAVLGG